MRLHVLSDLHLERADWKATSPPDVDVVILGGDIHRGTHGLKWARATYGDLPIIYIPGNHEFHRHSLMGLREALRDWGRGQGVYVLENESVEIGGMRFLGATLWTDLALLGNVDEACAVAADENPDYDRTLYEPDGRELCPADTRRLCLQTADWLRGEAERGRTRDAVIVTHHAPSKQCLKPGRREEPLSACFASNFDELVEQTEARLWIFGHTHWSVDLTIGRTRVLSNQRGYPGEDNNGFDPRLVIDL